MLNSRNKFFAFGHFSSIANFGLYLWKITLVRQWWQYSSKGNPGVHVIIFHVILGSVSPKFVMQALNYVMNDWPQCICYLQDNSYFLIFLENLNPLQSLVNLSEVWYEILLHICWRCNVYSYNLRPQIVDLFVVLLGCGLGTRFTRFRPETKQAKIFAAFLLLHPNP